MGLRAVLGLAPASRIGSTQASKSELRKERDLVRTSSAPAWRPELRSPFFSSPIQAVEGADPGSIDKEVVTHDVWSRRMPPLNHTGAGCAVDPTAGRAIDLSETHLSIIACSVTPVGPFAQDASTGKRG